MFFMYEGLGCLRPRCRHHCRRCRQRAPRCRCYHYYCLNWGWRRSRLCCRPRFRLDSRRRHFRRCCRRPLCCPFLDAFAFCSDKCLAKERTLYERSVGFCVCEGGGVRAPLESREGQYVKTTSALYNDCLEYAKIVLQQQCARE